MSIELIPRDTMVFLYESGRGIWTGTLGLCDEGYFFGNSYGNIYYCNGKWDGDSHIDDDYKPTHWMPLPTAPSDGRE